MQEYGHFVVFEHISDQSRASEASEAFGSLERPTTGCMWWLMDAHMPGSIYIKLSEFVEGRWAIQLGKKKFKF